MLRKLPSLERLIRQLQRVPYLASKNVYRIAAYFMNCSDAQVDQLCKAIIDARKNTASCTICFNWHESESLCSICADERRDNSSVCVVETWHELVAIERAGGYHGVYHVLGGVLSPLEGIGPEDLEIEPLIKRVKTSSVKELIFATNPTPEGEATASFIASKLKGVPVQLTKLASGIPVGSNLEYMDRVTIYKALSGRNPF